MMTALKEMKKYYRFRELKYLYSDTKKPEAVQMHIDDFLGLMETLQILSNKKLLRSIQKGLIDLKHGDVLSHKEVFG
ncbi:MAG: hypothetical protein HY800_08500 [Ignavibacteriales bacterium]|nr:hypothetical protein [Ignavibacteriales bacterium]